MDRKFRNILDTVLDLVELYASRFSPEGAVYCCEGDEGTTIFVGKAVIDKGQIETEQGIALVLDQVIDCERLMNELAKLGIIYKKIHIVAD